MCHQLFEIFSFYGVIHPAPKIKTLPLGQELVGFSIDLAPLMFLDADEAPELSGALGVSPSSVELAGEAPLENSFSKLESEAGYLWPFM